MRLLPVFVVVTLSSYIALSYEIVWMRAYLFLTGGQPNAVGFFLGAYLTGLAFGAWFARYACTQDRQNCRYHPLYLSGLFLLLANVAGFLVIPIVAYLVSAQAWSPSQTLPIVALAATLLGTSLPLVSHAGIPPDERVGERLSYLYMGNILGAVAGSFTTGFFLLDALTLPHLTLLLAALGILSSGVLILAASPPGHCGFTGVTLAAVVLYIIWLSPMLYANVYEKLLYQDAYVPGRAFAHVSENKSGVIAVSKSGTVYGSGAYDGQFNTNPQPGVDVNRVVRAYAVAAFHAAPHDILMIGLGSGSWLQVLLNHPDVATVTVVEINPGYVDMIRRYPVVASALVHPKLHLVIDDGRRYLRRTRRRFDLVVQNTIVHWRAHATSLLSREYLALARQRLKPGGVLYYNTTNNAAAHKTGATVFPFAWRFQNMLIGSDSPITINRERWRQKLLQWRIDGRPVLQSDRQGDRHRATLDRIVNQSRWRGKAAWEPRRSILHRTRREPVITDDNMATEW